MGKFPPLIIIVYMFLTIYTRGITCRIFKLLCRCAVICKWNLKKHRKVSHIPKDDLQNTTKTKLRARKIREVVKMKIFLKWTRSKDFLTSFHCKGWIADTNFLSSGLCKVNSFLLPLLFCPQRKTMTANEKWMQAHNIWGIFWLSLDSTCAFHMKLQRTDGITQQKR